MTPPYESVRERLVTLLCDEMVKPHDAVRVVANISRRDECKDVEFDSPLAGHPKELLVGLLDAARQEATVFDDRNIAKGDLLGEALLALQEFVDWFAVRESERRLLPISLRESIAAVLAKTTAN